jgi:glycosyltransferase involved in cell wall biosynthesis
VRIAFNGYFLTTPQTGSGRYMRNLLVNLGKTDPASEYYIVTSQQIADQPDTTPNIHWTPRPGNSFGLRQQGPRRLLWEQTTFPRAARRLGADLMHVPYFAPPFNAHQIPTVVTILDMIPQRMPVYRRRLFTKAQLRIAEQAARRATAVIAISRHCKQDIIELLGIPAERIFVTHLAPDAQLRPASYQMQQEVRARLGLHGPFVLNVGGMDIRKNLVGLVDAFARVYERFGDPRLRLFIAGNPTSLGTELSQPDWRPRAASQGVADKIICAPVDERDLAAIYSATDCFAFTSLYEGFGLTPLEAMACGAPVVCSDKTCLPEVVGEAAILVDPLDADALGSAILHVLASPETAQDLRARGLAHVRNFTWERTAAETQAVYAMAQWGMSHTR